MGGDVSYVKLCDALELQDFELELSQAWKIDVGQAKRKILEASLPEHPAA